MTTALTHSRASGRAGPEYSPAPAHQPWLQRKCACGNRAGLDGECEACRKRRLQRAAVRQPVGLAFPAEVDQVLHAPGRPLGADTRRGMDAHFGHRFDTVRIHDDAQAAASAAVVAARAYTVGIHVVFAAGEYREDSLASRKLLAHELTHVIQQGSGRSAGDDKRLEAEAEQAELGIGTGVPTTAVTGSAPMLARDEDADAVSDAETRADAAEAACDIRALCRLHFQAPERVDDARIRRVFSACHPDVNIYGLVGGSPCLTPNFGLPAIAPDAASGGALRTLAAPDAATPESGGAGASGGLALPSTTIRFNLGPAAFTVDLPASLAIRLPVPFQGAQRVVFTLNASPEEFSFSATINAVPHVRISARAAMTTEGAGSARLSVETTRTTCHAMDAAAARSALESAGNRLRDAIRAVQEPPPIPEDASSLERSFDPHMRYAEVVSAVANLNSAIERAGAACREVPVFSADFGVRGQLTRLESGEDAAPTYLGGSATFHF